MSYQPTEAVKEAAHKLRKVSYGLMFMSLMGIAGSGYVLFHAAHFARKMAGEDKDYVTRGEFDMYDAIKTAGGLMLFASLLSALIAKCGMRATWGELHHKSKPTKLRKMGRASIIGLVLVALCVLGAHHYGKHVVHIRDHISQVEHKHTQHQGDFPNDLPMHRGLSAAEASLQSLRNIDKSTLHPKVQSWFPDLSGENLMKNFKSMMMNMLESRFAPPDDSTCSPNKEEDSCNANPKCSWCRTNAHTWDMGSSCRSINSASHLPYHGWNCSKIPDEVRKASEKAITEQFGQAMHMDIYSDKQQECNSTGYNNEWACERIPGCSFCKPAAQWASVIKVKSHMQGRCGSTDNSKMIPAAFIECNNIDPDDQTWMTTFVSRLSYWAVMGDPVESEKRMLRSQEDLNEAYLDAEPRYGNGQHFHPREGREFDERPHGRHEDHGRDSHERHGGHHEDHGRDSHERHGGRHGHRQHGWRGEQEE